MLKKRAQILLSFVHTGSLSAHPVLFLHGFLGAKEDWEEITSLLSSTFSCHSIDLPGHGDSPFAQHIPREIVATLDNLNIFSCSLVGYSMGGRIALFLKEWYPERFSSVSILSSHTGFRNTKELEAKKAQDAVWREKLRTLPFEEFLHEWYAQPLFHSLKKNSLLFQKIFERRKKQNPVLLEAVLNNVSAGSCPPFSLTPPLLALYGEEDLKYASLYRRLHSSLLNVKKIPKSGHAVHLENPIACAQEIGAFLEQQGYVCTQ